MKYTLNLLFIILTTLFCASCGNGLDTAVPAAEDAPVAGETVEEVPVVEAPAAGEVVVDVPVDVPVAETPIVETPAEEVVTAAVEICDNTSDDDADGDIDCQDSDCLNDIQEISGDGIDQNCDGFDFVATDENVKWADAILGADKNADGTLNTTCSVDLPCKKIEHVLRGVSVGDTVALMQGQYVPRRDLYLNKGVKLLGGFFKDASGNLLRSYVHKPSTIRLESDVNILISPNSEQDKKAVSLDGLTILGKYATSTPVTGKIQVTSHPNVSLNHLTVVVDSEDVAMEAGAYAIKVDAIALLPKMDFNLVDSTVLIGKFDATATSLISAPVTINNHAAAALNANLLGNTLSCGKMSAAVKVNCYAVSGLESAMPIHLRLIDNTINMGGKNSVSNSYGYGVAFDSLSNGKFIATGNTLLASSKDASIGMHLYDALEMTIANNNFVMQDQTSLIAAVMVENSTTGNLAMIRQNIFDLGKSSVSQALYLTSTSAQILSNAFLQDEITSYANNIFFKGSSDVEQLTVSNNIFSNLSELAKNIYIAGDLYDGSSCAADYCTNIKAIAYNDFMFRGSVQDVSFFDGSGVAPSVATSSAVECAGFTTSGTVTSQACLVRYLAAMNTVTPARVTHNLSVPTKMSFDGEKHRWVLAEDSRLIDAGAVNSDIDTTDASDFYGQTRVVDGRPDGMTTIDIGPIEYQIVAE